MSRKLKLFRFSVFWLWLVTLLVVLGCFLYALNQEGLKPDDIIPSMGTVFAVIVPQISAMLAFLFAATAKRQDFMLKSRPGTATAAIVLALVYHAVFLLVAVLFVGFNCTDQRIDQRADVVVKITGLFSFLGAAPIAYLFGASPSD